MPLNHAVSTQQGDRCRLSGTLQNSLRDREALTQLLKEPLPFMYNSKTSFDNSTLNFYIHTYHPRFIPEGVAEVSQIFLRDTHVLPKLVSYEEHCRRERW
jgi:hypothetical protein